MLVVVHQGLGKQLLTHIVEVVEIEVFRGERDGQVPGFSGWISEDFVLIRRANEDGSPLG